MSKSRSSIMDLYFMDARSKLIDIAAFMDRVERAGEAEDYRYREWLKAFEALQSADRAEAILNKLSDPSEAPCERAGSPAAGAYKSD